MIWQVWAVLVLVGTAWAMVAFVAKEATTFASLAVLGHYTVAAVGAFNIESKFHTGVEPGAAILGGAMAIIGLIVAAASLTGQYPPGEQDTDKTAPGGGVLQKRLDRE